MDTGTLHTRREARRRAVRRRRQGVALIAAAIVAVAVIVLANRSGGSLQAPNSARPDAASTSALTHHASSSAQSASTTASTGSPGTEPVPILMYHVIAPPPPGAPFPGLYVTPSELTAQVQALKSAGWHAVTMDQVEAYWRRGVPLGPGKPIVLSFDNGYHSQYTQALPILHRVGWVGDENIQLSGLPPSQGGLSQEQVSALVAAGWELDTQGISHADLIALGPEQLHYQVAVARTMLQRRYHVSVNWFCYPSGHYDATVIAAVKAAGYTGSTTVVPGWAHPEDDPYRLHRLRVLGGTTPQQLLALIGGIREDPAAPASYNGA
jgi:peptidoglycan/xylan/chitin deacetylase (PgdA/CDA1 family)